MLDQDGIPWFEQFRLLERDMLNSQPVLSFFCVFIVHIHVFDTAAHIARGHAYELASKEANFIVNFSFRHSRFALCLSLGEASRVGQPKLKCYVLFIFFLILVVILIMFFVFVAIFVRNIAEFIKVTSFTIEYAATR